ncbi:caspase-like [Anopheles funestus]|uniref:caspase-like n=1 Tax=Anopheles funestus TaxID=62324 RepID=UPI0020C6E57E|nr:caspase-like [Anopheles funestus]
MAQLQLLRYRSYPKRGVALIFVIHENRKGSKKDLKDLEAVLLRLQFEVRKHVDCTAAQVRGVLEKVSKEDHNNNECLLIVSMTHGSKEKLTFKDRDISVDELWDYFIGNKCASLFGKPKLVFVQSCRGNKYDAGTRKCLDSEPPKVEPVTVCLPMYADLLVMYSTYEDHVSFRCEKEGSWFIQSLCQVLACNIAQVDLLRLLTHVTYLVSCRSDGSGENIVKQTPTINSTLSKAFYFLPK